MIRFPLTWSSTSLDATKSGWDSEVARHKGGEKRGDPFLFLIGKAGPGAVHELPAAATTCMQNGVFCTSQQNHTRSVQKCPLLPHTWTRRESHISTRTGPTRQTLGPHREENRGQKSFTLMETVAKTAFSPADLISFETSPLGWAFSALW